MCGIGGVIHPRSTAADDAAMARMAGALGHRGPDRTATFVDGPLGLAHTRLSIQDPGPGGDQPFVDAESALVYNGELYNAPALRAELEADGVAFTGTSDTEVLFRLVKARGLDAALQAIDGMYAFAWAERRSHRVVLCRDPLGIKPCHWVERHGSVWWASEVAGLRAVLDVRPNPVRTLAAVLGRNETVAASSLFAGVRMVPPGGLVELVEGRVTGERLHHDPADLVDPDHHRALSALSFDAAVAELGVILDRSVDRMLLSDVPVGSMISGGVDSSLIALTAAPLDPDHHLFTAEIVGPHSEAAFAAEVAALVGGDLVRARFEPDDLLRDWALATHHHESPIITHVNSLPFRRVAQAAADAGVKVVLTGEGSDELFLGYPRLAFSRYGRVLGAPLRGLFGAYGRVPRLMENAAPEFDQRQPVFLADLTEDFSGARADVAGREAFAFLPPAEAERQALSFDFMTRHLPTLLHRNDRMGMAAGVEARFPFLDPELVRFGMNLPYRHKIRTARRVHDKKHPFQVDKGIVRALAAQRMPEHLAYRRKDGFPMHGHLAVQCERGLFTDGYVVDLVGLTPGGLDHLMAQAPPYYLAKLASVEVFGRLFAWDHAVDDVTAHLARHARVAA